MRRAYQDLENRENPAPEGYFYVQFILEPTEKGFLSLGIIDLAARNVDNENLTVKVLNCTDNPKLVMFHILGKNGADPDEYAEEIRSLCKQWGVLLDGVYEYKKKVRRQTAYDRIRKRGSLREEKTPATPHDLLRFPLWFVTLFRSSSRLLKKCPGIR